MTNTAPTTQYKQQAKPLLSMHNYIPLVISGNDKNKQLTLLTRFRRTSDGEVIPGPEQGFDIVGGYFSADLKSSLSHSLKMHFPITRSSMAFLKVKVMWLS